MTAMIHRAPDEAPPAPPNDSEIARDGEPEDVQVDLTLLISPEDALLLRSVLENPQYFPTVLEFLTPWRSKAEIIVKKIEKVQW